MPSWDVHTAHVERLLWECGADALGIADTNAFLFGNYVPDLYLGFMVADTTYRLDYCLTHLAEPHSIPVPKADLFWDTCVHHRTRKPDSPAGVALVLGAWAHLCADRLYNGMFRLFSEEHNLVPDDNLRVRKQADFHLFGSSLPISKHVQITPELLDAALAFRPYSILPKDVKRAVDVATAIVDAAGACPEHETYLLLSESWMREAFTLCHEHLATWLLAWQERKAYNASCSAADLRHFTGLKDPFSY